MVLPVKSGRPKVNKLHSRVPHASDVPLGGGAVFAVPVVGYEQNIFRLQIRVSQMIFVEKLDSIAKLVGHMTDLLQWITNVAIALEKIKDGLSENLKGETHVTVEVEGVEHSDTEMFARGILSVQIL
jgi:hypothetical protein